MDPESWPVVSTHFDHLQPSGFGVPCRSAGAYSSCFEGPTEQIDGHRGCLEGWRSLFKWGPGKPAVLQRTFQGGQGRSQGLAGGLQVTQK